MQKGQKSGVIAITLLVVAISIIATTTTATNVTVKASSNNNNNDCAERELVGEILCGVDNAARGYTQGVSDGKNAALNGQSNQCPQSDGLSGYCLGFASGWNRVSNAQETLNDANNGNNNNNNNNDDDNDDNGNATGRCDEWSDEIEMTRADLNGRQSSLGGQLDLDGQMASSWNQLNLEVDRYNLECAGEETNYYEENLS